MKIVFASGNPGKLREAAEILGDKCVLLTPSMLGVKGEAEETGNSFAENSYLKAKYLWDRVFGDLRSELPEDLAVFADGMPDAIIADDSGLEVDALDGAPGIYTARYAGESHDFHANMTKLLAALKECGAESPAERSARFRCIVSLIYPDGSCRQFSGAIEGWICLEEAGCGGFGYDPLFVPTDEELAALGEKAVEQWSGKTLAEIPEDLKNGISHRYKALICAFSDRCES